MRSPEHRRAASPKAGKNFDVDLHLRYLSPGAFTVLPPNGGPPPDPPSAPDPYRLTPTVKRNKHQSFAIIGEINGSQSASRSSSPTGGRVSPFRGHGFNPAGSRLASPVPSPPPEDVRLTPTKQSPAKQSRIPQYSRRGSVFGDRVSHLQSPPSKRKFNQNLSQSLTNLEPSKRPPQHHSNKRTTKKTSYHQLSPIVGSSPEPTQSLSSPLRLPKSQSQPTSRITSPSRRPPRAARPSNNTQSSSDSSQVPNPTSPTRIPIKKFHNVQSKVNSFKRPSKPQVPPKPPVLSTSDQTDSDATQKTSTLSRLRRTQSKLVLTKPNINSNANNNNNTNKKSVTNNNTTNNNNKINVNKIFNTTNNNNKNWGKGVVETNKNAKSKPVNSTIKAKNDTTTEEETVKPLSELIQPSATTVVSSTTTTVTKPLKIDAKIDPPLQYDQPKPVSPMVDGRVLSATSVSNAMNRMNDSVLDTRTLIRDHAKFSPAAKSVLSLNSAKRAMPTAVQQPTTISTKAAMKTVEETTVQTNHVTHAGVVDGKALESNISKLISPDRSMGNSVHKSLNDRLVEARTVIAEDVQPIRITVKEKPSEIEVQSGNVRVSGNSMNGISGDRPSLPPSNHSPPNEPESTESDGKKSNACIRFFTSIKSKFSRNKENDNKKSVVSTSESQPRGNEEGETDGDSEKTGCFSCGNKKIKKKSEVRINIEDEDEEPKKSCLERMKCCGKNKVGDTSCFPSGKRKDSWAERRDSILSDPPPPQPKCSKDCCRRFWRKVFCMDCCKKKPVDIPVSRKPSTVSKKKSLTPTSVPPPPEDTRSKLDMSLVEHMSHMRAAIPVLPIYLAWICLVLNCIGPGTGTVFSGLFCLCVGKPRFSQHDGPKPRFGAFLINSIVGFGQFFTVLFCLVGWGWSIWWGVIMLKLSKKYRKLKQIQAIEEANEAAEAAAAAAGKAKKVRDPERGS